MSDYCTRSSIGPMSICGMTTSHMPLNGMTDIWPDDRVTAEEITDSSLTSGSRMGIIAATMIDNIGTCDRGRYQQIEREPESVASLRVYNR